MTYHPVSKHPLLVTLGALLALDATEAVLQSLYGSSSWGFQPGGDWNRLVLTGLALVFVATALFQLCTAASRRQFVLRSLAACVGCALIVAAYLAIGWRAFTSIHNQGNENLLLFLAENVSILLMLATAMFVSVTAPDKRT